jgi:prepilin-type N-terminal cleavage/methylation domain-containing protein
MRKHGFTLIELSIVLVIIGLIVGGVLVGQDLIRAAEIRATVGQKEKFDAAAVAFKLKYGALPGDIQPATAGAFGLFQLTGNCGGTCTVNRFGDGKINRSYTGVNSVWESFAFWRHLSEANLIEGKYGSDVTNPINATNGWATATPSGYLKLFSPEAKIGGGKYFGLNESYRYVIDGGMTWYYTKFAADYSINGQGSDYSTPIIAQAIDSKIDDGKPNTGNVVDFTGAEGAWSATPINGLCTYGGTNENAADTQYNINPSTGGNTGSCYLAIAAGF